MSVPPPESKPRNPEEEAWQRRQEEMARKQQEAFKREQERQDRERLDRESRNVPSSQVSTLWQQYEQKWDQLRDKEHIHWMHIPWPMIKRPSEPEDINVNGIGAFVLSPHHSQDKSDKDRLKEQLRRWHPDRFETKVLKRVVEGEKDRVRQGAKQVAISLNTLMERKSNANVFGE